MIRLPRAILSLAALTAPLAAAPAHAEIVEQASDGFILHFEGAMPMAPEAAWERLLDIAAWWTPEHTYSGDAANLSIAPEAGGCWCEIWEGGAVEHGRVLMLNPPVQARFDAPLGPLQGVGVTAILTVTMSYPDTEGGAAPDETPIVFDYVVAGSSLSNLEALAPAVDGVIGAQFARLTAP